MAHYAYQFLIHINLFSFLYDASNYGIGLHFSKKKQFRTMELVSANSRLFSTTELILSTNLSESSAIIYAFSEYEFLIEGSQRPIILYTEHNHILICFTQKEQTKTQSLSIPVNLNEVCKFTHSLDGRQEHFTSRSIRPFTYNEHTR